MSSSSNKVWIPTCLMEDNKKNPLLPTNKTNRMKYEIKLFVSCKNDLLIFFFKSAADLILIITHQLHGVLGVEHTCDQSMSSRDASHGSHPADAVPRTCTLLLRYTIFCRLSSLPYVWIHIFFHIVNKF